MTNNQNWPDMVYLRREKEGNSYFDLIDHTNRNGGSEYVSAEKVREIQLATIVKTLEAAIKRFILAEKDMVPNPISVLKNIKPESIIEQVKI